MVVVVKLMWVMLFWLIFVLVSVVCFWVVLIVSGVCIRSRWGCRLGMDFSSDVVYFMNELVLVIVMIWMLVVLVMWVCGGVLLLGFVCF